MGRLKLMIAVLCLTGWVHAESSQDLFKQGNAAYAAGQFAQAAQSYEAARTQGLNHWILEYNLGNAWYKSGQTGKAVVHYLRAFRLNSHQNDVIYNLNLVLTRAGDPLLPEEALAGLFWRLFYALSLNWLAVLTSALFLAVCFGSGMMVLGKIRFRPETVAGALILFMAMAVWFGMRISLAEQPEAVVVSGTAEVRSAPNLETPANFTVPEGRRVLILDHEPVQGWMEIGVPQEGLKGWVPAASIEAV
jgi:hypothetical protein